MTIATNQAWRENAKLSVQRALKVLAPRHAMRGSEWAEKHFYLSAESSYIQKKWECYPPQIFILDCMCNDAVEEIYIPKAKRMGYTKMLLAASFYLTKHARRKQCIWQPTNGDAEEFTTTEYDTAISDVPELHDIFPALEKKHKHNTTSLKKFIGAITYIKGGESAKNYRRISIDVGIQDESDAFSHDVDGEGRSDELIKGRLEGSTFPKFISGSTPKSKWTSLICHLVENADSIFKYHVPCPHCDHEQVLLFGDKKSRFGLKYQDNNPETAAYLCAECGALFTQADYFKVWQRGRWIDQKGNWYDQVKGIFYDVNNEQMPRPPRRIGVKYFWSILSPQVTWVDIVDKWIKAQAAAKRGDKGLLKTFTNLILGESYEDEVDQSDFNTLYDKAEDYPLGIVPRGGLSIFAGVDVQYNRFELYVWAFGRNKECWLIDYQLIDANPTIQAEWDKLDTHLLKIYPHVAGTMLSIENVGIDSGNWTHKAYQYVRDRQTRSGWSEAVGKTMPHVHATKGASKPDAQIVSKPSLQDIKVDQNIIKDGVKLYVMGVNELKDDFYESLQVNQFGNGYVHLSKHFPEKVFKQLTSEVRVKKLSGNKEVSIWAVKQGERNEALDCAIIARYLVHKSGFAYKAAAEWERLESIVQPMQSDLFAFVADDGAQIEPVQVITTTQKFKINSLGARR